MQFKDKIIDFGGDLSIDDTAAIIMNCDYIITTDTMVAHLSGALCKNTFILTLKVPHWIWGLNSEETLWYSSVKLCRQSINQNWDGVLERIKNELEQL